MLRQYIQRSTWLARFRRSAGIWLALPCILLPLAATPSLPTVSESTTFVCNETLATDCLPPTDFANIISGYKKRIDQGSVIRVVIVKGDPSYHAALRLHINKTNAQFLNHWRRLVFTGRGLMPAAFDSKEDAIAYLSVTPNAIGLFHYDGALPPGVRILALCPAGD